MMDYGLSAYAAIGAASRVQTSGSDRGINLLAPQSTMAAGLKRKMSVVLVCIISVAFLSICASLILRVMAGSLMNRALSIQQNGEISSFQTYRELAAIETEAALLKTRIDATRAIINSAKHVDWGELLQEIGALVPENMWLNEFSWEDDDDLSLGGYALSYDSVFELRDTLTDSRYFSSAKLVSAKKSEIKSRMFVEFEIICGIRQEMRSFDEIAQSK